MKLTTEFLPENFRGPFATREIQTSNMEGVATTVPDHFYLYSRAKYQKVQIFKILLKNAPFPILYPLFSDFSYRFILTYTYLYLKLVISCYNLL